MCGDGTCLESDDVCNGENDCADFSDEDLCRKYLGTNVCYEKFFEVCNVSKKTCAIRETSNSSMFKSLFS